MASLSDLVPLVQELKRAGYSDAEIPGIIQRMHSAGLHQSVQIATGQQETQREQQGLQDAAAAQQARAQTGMGLLDDAYRRSQQLIDLQRDPDNIVAYYAAIAGLPEASAQPVTDLLGQGFQLKPSLPSPYTDPRYQQLQDSLYDFGRPRTAAETIAETSQNRQLALNQFAADQYKANPQAFLAWTQATRGMAKGGRMMLNEPVVGMGAFSKRPLFTAAEYGPEQMGEQGGKLQFTPMRGVPQKHVPDSYQMQLMEMAGVPPMRNMMAYAEGGGYDVGRQKDEEEVVNPTTRQSVRPKFTQTGPWDPAGRVQKAYAGEVLPGTTFGPSTSTRGINPGGNVQYQIHPITGKVQIVANPVGYPGLTLNEHANASAPGQVRQITPEEAQALAARAFKERIDQQMQGVRVGADASPSQAAQAMAGAKSLLEYNATGTDFLTGGARGGDPGSSREVLNINGDAIRAGIEANMRNPAVVAAMQRALGNNPNLASQNKTIAAALAPGGFQQNALPDSRTSAAPVVQDRQIPRTNEQVQPFPLPRPFAAGGTLEPVDAAFDSLAKVLERNPFVHPDMLNAIRNRQAPPPGSVTQRFLKNTLPSTWQSLQAAIRGKAGGTFLDDYLTEIPKFYHQGYQTYGTRFI